MTPNMWGSLIVSGALLCIAIAIGWWWIISDRRKKARRVKEQEQE